MERLQTVRTWPQQESTCRTRATEQIERRPRRKIRRLSESYCAVVVFDADQISNPALRPRGGRSRGPDHHHRAACRRRSRCSSTPRPPAWRWRHRSSANSSSSSFCSAVARGKRNDDGERRLDFVSVDPIRPKYVCMFFVLLFFGRRTRAGRGALPWTQRCRTRGLAVAPRATS